MASGDHGRFTTDAQAVQHARPDFVCSRLFDAPRRLVFGAFANADILARWWGPEGFTSRFDEFNFTPGGTWRFVMHGPDGATYEMLNEFVDVRDDERIVLQHHQPGHDFRLEMSYADEAAQTRLSWRFWFESADEAERVRPFLDALNEQNFDRLEAQLMKLRQPTPASEVSSSIARSRGKPAPDDPERRAK